MSGFDCEVVVIGAGVVGLACGLALSRAGLSALVLEREARAGEGISSRNSGVIHAGLYYPLGSLKARLCVRGRDLLYAFCERHHVRHRRCGKWVVAVNSCEHERLARLQAHAAANGVVDLRWCEPAEVAAREPGLRCAAALDVPVSGILDVPEYVMALIGQLEAAGGQLLTHCAVERITPVAGGCLVQSLDGGVVRARRVVNAAGLGAIRLAATIEGFAAAQLPRLHYAAGHYYRCRREVPFQRLVYPLPQAQGLGVHLGFDAAGEAHFGPDVRYLEREDYRFDDSQRGAFADAIRGWWPDLQDDDLLPDFVGIRPKLAGPQEPLADFVIQDARQHGIVGLINLFGIESPGLTASLAIAEAVLERIESN